MVPVAGRCRPLVVQSGGVHPHLDQGYGLLKGAHVDLVNTTGLATNMISFCLLFRKNDPSLGNNILFFRSLHQLLSLGLGPGRDF